MKMKLRAYYYRKEDNTFDASFFIDNLGKYKKRKDIVKLGLCLKATDKEFKKIIKRKPKHIKRLSDIWEVRNNKIFINRKKIYDK